MPTFLHASMPTFLHASMPLSSVAQTRWGFTLAALLISVAVLGLISVLTLPSMLNNVQLNQRKAVLKETIASLQTCIKKGVEAGEIINNPTTRAYLRTCLNTTRIQTTKCSPHSYNYTFECFVLPTGATIDIPTNNITYDFLYIDANGSNPPNQVGEDWLSMNWNSNPVSSFPRG
ncbi:MAG: type II secretion system protein, partial [Dolichospermum sp.]